MVYFFNYVHLLFKEREEKERESLAQILLENQRKIEEARKKEVCLILSLGTVAFEPVQLSRAIIRSIFESFGVRLVSSRTMLAAAIWKRFKEHEKLRFGKHKSSNASKMQHRP